ncbi:arsenite-translocating ATPase [Entamoeba histolytica HM-3:IMSS]|uniref:ATPase ASNA1 homolog n=5 Tax=Entamoeba histolytica TaxID=5759 RepID=ASNA_ENTH1|nr:arsenite-translocating ATPase, putative [Entamoeba histolytica HM-1:IMSS]C4LY44.1 RecName: Full=ATPase ASNA1 homolog; AltName: Full=Arsenical pump-driving ATPase homolog; AltName: Full=Arsenite-stimulated ATPase [Entamoeba histolytica HM-1:IMSS]EMD44155.1 arsenite-translocating ATPase, putative [Entamoeba histolytica KU27]EMS12998.1 arsenite-translocating ATPase [Entamoeba histolytica HM-3:IMSS]BAN39185.1 arsenite-translocating ATPase, putative [Entamoeba histolytica]EAL43902.1 arsenite-tra|eukprot:XP_649286.1 arsenite-translocating ATPase, putative [Entamoeba histolytica HM-1:IMSS]
MSLNPPNNLEHIITSQTLKWVFVGGKGGVGKTTTSCSLGVLIADRNPQKKVLIISTDPAHNTSDAFDIKFGAEPKVVPGVPNLSVMEIDVKDAMKGVFDESEQGTNQNGGFGLLSELTGMMGMLKSVPGIDEAIAFSQIINQAQQMNYDLVLFDTAPTGHTLRFLSLPTLLRDMLEKVIKLQDSFGPMMSQFGGMMGMNINFNELKPKMEHMLKTSEQIVEDFTNPNLTTFIPVLIPEFLPLYETERLIQELMNLNMDANSIIVNQILPVNDCCDYCKNKRAIQAKYLGQIDVLYGDFHLIKINMQTNEVRGVAALRAFSKNFEAKH